MHEVEKKKFQITFNEFTFKRFDWYKTAKQSFQYEIYERLGDTRR